MTIREAVRSSEFWVAVATAVGQALASFGVIPVETWDKVVFPALVYVGARVTGKVAKGALGSGSKSLLGGAGLLLAGTAQAAPSLLSLERVSAEVGVGYRYGVDHVRSFDVFQPAPRVVAEVGYSVLPSLRLKGEAWLPTDHWKSDKEARLSLRWVLRR